MSRNYSIATLILLIVAFWIISLIPNTVTRESGTVIYNYFYNDYFISIQKNGTTEWIKLPAATSPTTRPTISPLAAFDGQMIDFELSNKVLSTINACLPGISIYSGGISNISIRNYTSSKFDAAWTQVVVSCAAFLIAIILWRRFKLVSKKIQGDRIPEKSGVFSEDLGVFFFGAALILWAMTALIALYGNPVSQNRSVITMLSISNDYLFAMSFPFFRHGLPMFNRNREYYVLIFTGLFFVTLVLSSLNISIMPFTAGNYAEAYFTAIVLGTLGYLLNESFVQRGTPLTGLVSIFCSLVAIFCQMTGANPGLQYYLGKWSNMLYLSSFVMIVVLYITLIYSWYAEEREKQVVIEKEIANATTEIPLLSPEDYQTLKKNLKILIRRGNILDAFTIMEEKFENDDAIMNAITNFRLRYNAYKNSEIKNTLDYQSRDLLFNTLIEGILKFIDVSFSNK